MKKSLLLVAFGALFLAGCQKEQVEGFAVQDKVIVNFTAELSDGAATKASFDGDGAGVYADQCKLQVWWGSKLFYEKTVAVTDFKASFTDIALIRDQTYDFLFWADNAAGAYYDTDTLTNVRLIGTYVGGNDKRDAFSAALTGKKVTEAFSTSVKLYRPFAQLNVITTDIPALRTLLTDDELFAASVPDKVSLKVTVPTVFNVKTGVASEPKELTYTASVYTNPYKTTAGAKNTLSMDYFLAPATEGNVVDVKFSSKNTTSGLADINHTFSNIPLRRNYRTNVIGALLSVTGTISVEIKPAWLDETDVEE